jgi:CRISPR-associated protein Cmr3
MKRYLLTLTPLSDFFFGGEYTFGADEERKEGSRYRAVSRRFPSQSAIVGALRRAVLIEAGCMSLHKRGEWVDRRGKKGTPDSNYDEAVRLCGSEPFSYERGIEMGILKSFSPLLIRQGEHFYIPAPPDMGLQPLEGGGRALLGDRSLEPAWSFTGYDPKKGIKHKLLGDDGTKTDYEKFFEKVSTVGIKKSRTGKTEENAFFIKESWKFKDKAHFAFFLESSEALPFEKTQIFLGADRSAFLLQAVESDDDPTVRFAKYIPSNGKSRLVTIGETILTPEATEHCRFILGERVRQRTIISNKNGKFGKSVPFFRYEPGSVLYTDEPEKLTEKLATTGLRKSGINHTITIK